MRGLRLGAFVAVSAITACGATATSSPTPDATVIARVGHQTVARYQFDVRYHSVLASIQQGGASTTGAGAAAMVAQVRLQVMQSLITDAVIQQEATFRGLAATDKEVSAEVATDQSAAGGAAALQQQLKDAGGSLAQLRDEIASRLNEEHLEDFFAKQRADAVAAQLAQGADFSALAHQYSDDTSSANAGGDLGVVTAAQLSSGDAAFSSAVNKLAVGATSALIRDADGYDIVRKVAQTATGGHLLRILISAPQPYTVKGRPQWFSESLLQALAQLCAQNQVTVYTSDDPHPCAVASPAATP